MRVINIDPEHDKKFFEKIIKDCEEKEIDVNTVRFQTTQFYDFDHNVLEIFNKMILEKYPDLSFRIFHLWRNTLIDLENLKYIIKIKNLQLEGDELANIEILEKLYNLEKLTLSIKKIENLDFLKNLTNLEELNLLNGKSLKPSVENIKYLKKLEVLKIEKYKKGLEYIKELDSLKNLTLTKLEIKNWDIFPSHELDNLSLINVKSEIPFNKDFVNVKNIFGVGKYFVFEENSEEDLDFLLTNNERKYLGVELVEEHWDLVRLTNNYYLYFDGNIIRKGISVSKDGYRESQFYVETENREFILPKTSKGKIKKLTGPTFWTSNPEGVYFAFSFNLDSAYRKSSFMIGNYTTQQSLYNKLFFDVPKIKNYVELREFINKFIEETTDEHLQELEEFKNAKRKRIKYKIGDFFRVRIGRSDKYVFGRILIAVDDFYKDKDYIDYKNYGLSHLMGRAVFAKLYNYIGEKDTNINELLSKKSLPVFKTTDNDIYYGEYEIVGNIPLKESDLEDMWMSYNRSISYNDRRTVYFQWGMIYCEVDLDNLSDDLKEKGFFRQESLGASLGVWEADEFFACYESKSNKPYWDNIKHYERSENLRNPKYDDIRYEVIKFFGLNPELNYAENFKIWAKDKDMTYLNRYKLK